MLQKATAMALGLLCICLAACTSDSGTKESAPAAPVVKEVRDYHDNGVLKIKGTSIDGKRSGMWQSYYPSGLRWSETHFRNGVKEGPTVTYFPNGMMRYTGFYHDDDRSGLWVFYDTLGTVLERIDMDTHPAMADSLLRTTSPPNF